MWKFWPIFFNLIWLYDTQNTFDLIVRGLKNEVAAPLTHHAGGTHPPRGMGPMHGAQSPTSLEYQTCTSAYIFDTTNCNWYGWNS